LNKSVQLLGRSSVYHIRTTELNMTVTAVYR